MLLGEYIAESVRWGLCACPCVPVKFGCAGESVQLMSVHSHIYRPPAHSSVLVQKNEGVFMLYGALYLCEWALCAGVLFRMKRFYHAMTMYPNEWNPTVYCYKAATTSSYLCEVIWMKAQGSPWMLVDMSCIYHMKGDRWQWSLHSKNISHYLPCLFICDKWHAGTSTVCSDYTHCSVKWFPA